MTADRRDLVREYKETPRIADRELQADWNRYGADAFEFDELDRLEPKDEPGYDPRPELAALDAMWREKLAASGHALYARPLGRI